MANEKLEFPAYEALVSEEGTLTLPTEALESLGIHPGDFVTLIAAQGGLMLVPTRLIAPEVAERIERILAEEGMTVSDLLAGLDEEGGKLFQEQYGHLLSG